ncbi:MAG: hypothetical protein WCA89_10625 [Terracidiphilus sp.]
MPRLEDFWAGKPLTPELERLRDGVEDRPEASQEQPEAAFDDLERPLYDEERKELTRLVASAGWQVLERLMERTCATLERSAIVLSQNDPLANADAIARGWAYFGMWKDMRKGMQALIDEEVKTLKRSAAKQD